MVETVNRTDETVRNAIIPLYTEWEGLNVAIDRIVKGEDEEHPVFGLGQRIQFHGVPFNFKRNGEEIVGVRIVFPASDQMELSYLLRLNPNGSVIVANEGWCPRCDIDEYGAPKIKTE